MNLTAEKAQLTGLLNKINVLEKRKRWRLLAATILPIALAAGLLYYFTTRILRAQKQVSGLQQTVVGLRRESDSMGLILKNLKSTAAAYNKNIDSVKKFYEYLSYEYVKDFGWTKDDVINPKNPKLVEQSRVAYDSIIVLLKSQTVSIKTNVRYYTKKTDRGRVDIALLKCGLRALYIFNDSYLDSVKTNVIHYSVQVPEANVKLIAFALLRAGVGLKAILPYPKESELGGKANSIEISGDAGLEGRKAMTVKEVGEWGTLTKD
jgi:hypothetical protein